MESIGGNLRQMQRTPLAASDVEALRRVGKVVNYPKGAFVARPGEPADRFVYLEEGEIEVVDPYTDQRHLPSTLGGSDPMPNSLFGQQVHLTRQERWRRGSVQDSLARSLQLYYLNGIMLIG